MVQNSEKTYGELMLEARDKNDRQEVGETLPSVLQQLRGIINEAVQKNYEKGVKGRYYIHIWVQKDPYAANALHIYPQCRRSRPSPYQSEDHFLWSVDDGGKVNFEWCIPRKEVLRYILSHPNEFDPSYVQMLRRYGADKLENISDYMFKEKVI